jgi:NAD(P)-dependent dehydrogenase (short-subunit alcohol dehydrogenase family)
VLAEFRSIEPCLPQPLRTFSDRSDFYENDPALRFATGRKALCSSKAAFSLLSDALRLELRPDGIRVCLIEPGAIHTPAVDKTLGDADGAVASLPPEGRARYEPALRDFIRRGLAREIHGSAPEIVAQTIERALTEKRPRYAVGAHARDMVTLSRLLPDRLLDQARLRALGLSTKFG